MQDVKFPFDDPTSMVQKEKPLLCPNTLSTFKACKYVHIISYSSKSCILHCLESLIFELYCTTTVDTLTQVAFQIQSQWYYGQTTQPPTIILTQKHPLLHLERPGCPHLVAGYLLHHSWHVVKILTNQDFDRAPYFPGLLAILHNTYFELWVRVLLMPTLVPIQDKCVSPWLL